MHEYEWIPASADKMPFADGRFDLMFCQHGLQFFPDKPAALADMHRVLGQGGRLVLTCWAAVPPFFEIVSEVLARHLGEAASRIATDPFTWNDAALIVNLLAEAGFETQEPHLLPVIRRMAASHATMREEILATPNEPALRDAGDRVIRTIVDEILTAVECYREGDSLAWPQQAHLFVAIAA